MSISRKYGRTFHFPFSPGTTSDDRTNFDWWEDFKRLVEVVITEKLDGENSCINSIGVFSRSHAAPNMNPWSTHLKEKRALILKDIEEGELEIFGENLYAIHSIEYKDIDEHFYVFGIRVGDEWLSWEETEEICYLLDLKTVPVIGVYKTSDFDSPEDFVNLVMSIVGEESTFGSKDSATDEDCTMEGVVVRTSDSYKATVGGQIDSQNVFKYVRENHVKTDEHWVKNWKVAKLNHW
ncbi:MAG: putative RNA ligase [uncultured marine phage]|uniref:Putative RNA ligase n=1 Tax=uncultured marine phage TaxID=707152 RepID=A0A8D9CA51_9VIRU|nr:MAG: putative RNA ligase [uncultured marine phage]